MFVRLRYRLHKRWRLFLWRFGYWWCVGCRKDFKRTWRSYLVHTKGTRGVWRLAFCSSECLRGFAVEETEKHERWKAEDAEWNAAADVVPD